MKDQFFSKGWENLYEKSELPPPGGDDDYGQISDKDVRKAWGILTSSFSDKIRQSLDKVPRGQVIQLLRKLKDHFYRPSMHTKDVLKDALYGAKLEDHSDLNDLITFLETTVKRLGTLGYKVDDDDLRYHLLKALPNEYQAAITTIKLPRPDPQLTWDQTLSLLRDVAERPNVPGTISKKKINNEGIYSTQFKDTKSNPKQGNRSTGNPNSQIICRNGAQGKCRHPNCHFKHPPRPTKDKSNIECFYCKKKGHMIGECRKKKRDEQAKGPAPQAANNGTFQGQQQQFQGQQVPQPQQPQQPQPQSEPAHNHGQAIFNSETLSEVCLSAARHEGESLIDGGATCHVTITTENCYNFKQCKTNIRVGGSMTLQSHLVCSKTLAYYLEDGTPRIITLTDVRYLPHFGTNVLSEVRLQKGGCKIEKDFDYLRATVNHGKGLVILDLRLKGRPLFYVKEEDPQEVSVQQQQQLTPKTGAVFHVSRQQSDTLSTLQLWHQRLGHRNFSDVCRILGISAPPKMPFCRACVEGKITRYPFASTPSKPLNTSPRPGYLLHTDVFGPFRATTRGGKKFALLFVDDFSRKIFLYLLGGTSEVFEFFRMFLHHLEADFGRERVVSKLLSDGASYYNSHQFANLCNQKGILHIFSPPYTPERNGVAERSGGSLIEDTRTMLIQASAPTHLYGEAMAYAVVIKNRTPMRFKDGSHCSRLEKWHGRKMPDAHRSLRTFGCAAWPLSPDWADTTSDHDKLIAKAKLHILLGIDAQRQCYRLAEFPTLKLIFSSHVIFHEDEFPFAGQPERPLSIATSRVDYRLLNPGNQADGDPVNDPPVVIQQPSDESSQRRSLRGYHPSAKELERVVHHVLNTAGTDGAEAKDPKTRREAMSGRDSKTWRLAEIEEFKSQISNKTFGPATNLPPGRRAITPKIVYKTKRDGRKKARLVLHGFLMESGMEYNETFAPVSRKTTILALLAYATKEDLELIHLDLKTAFLNSDIDTEVYVYLPPAFNLDTDPQPEARPSTTVHRLLKGIPGIPQGSFLFNQEFSKALRKLGLHSVPGDDCLFTTNDKKIFLAIWVDDSFLAYASNQEQRVQQLIQNLKQNFEVHILGQLTDLLGVKITRDRPNRVTKLSQAEYLRQILEKAGMSNCSSEPTPIASGTVFTKGDCPPPEEINTPENVSNAKWYRSILASCIYASVWTRVDLSFPISKLCKFMANPGPKHVKQLKRLLRYIKGTIDLALSYDFSSDPPREGLYGYHDSAQADDVDTSRSTMAYVFQWYGATISWQSKLHSSVTLSTNHSEYVCAAKAAREAAWLRKIFSGIGLERDVTPIDLYSDSSGAISLAHNPVNHETNKHIRISYHFVREQVSNGNITISHVSTNEMIADFLTKQLPQFKMKLFMKQLGLR